MGEVNWTALREQLGIWRRLAKLNQSELGRRVGLNKSTIHRIENTYGKKKNNPDLETVEKIVIACGSTLSQFFEALEKNSMRVTGSDMVKGGKESRLISEEIHAPTISEADVVRIARRAVDLIESERRSATQAVRRAPLRARTEKPNSRKHRA